MKKLTSIETQKNRKSCDSLKKGLANTKPHLSDSEYSDAVSEAPRIACLEQRLLLEISGNHRSCNLAFKAQTQLCNTYHTKKRASNPSKASFQKPRSSVIRKGSEKTELSPEHQKLRALTKAYAELLKVKPYDPSKDHEEDPDILYNKPIPAIDPDYLLKEVGLCTQQIVELFKTGHLDLDSWCLGSRTRNLAFQSFLESLDEKDCKEIAAQMVPRIPYFMVEKHGNYVIKKMIDYDKDFMKSVECYCRKNFKALADDEYSSRVMQSLVDSSPEFLDFVVDHFKKDLKPTFTKISLMFILVAAIRKAASQKRFEFLIDYMEANPQVFDIKLFKRILISFIQYATEDEVLATWNVVINAQNLEALLKDRFGSLLFLMLIRRGHPVVLGEIGLLMKQRVDFVFSTKFYKSITSKLTYSKYCSFRMIYLNSLLNISPKSLKALKSQDKKYTEYVYSVLSQFDAIMHEPVESKAPKMPKFLQMLDKFILKTRAIQHLAQMQKIGY